MGTISFAFADQADFSPANFATPYDCEAFFCWQDSLHVFTKDWVNGRTKHYVFSANPGHYDVLPRDSFEVEGLITGATIAEDGVIGLLGYNALESFIWLLFDYSSSAIFSGNKRKIDLGTFTTLGQTEGITFSRPGEGYLASEELFYFTAQHISFSSGQWTAPQPTMTSYSSSSSSVYFFPNPFSTYLQIERTTEDIQELILYDLDGRLIKGPVFPAADVFRWNLRDLSPGNYVLRIKKGGRYEMRWVVKTQ